MEPTAGELEKVRAYELATQAEHKLIYFLTAGAMTILGFSIQTAPEEPIDGTLHILVASWAAFLASGLFGLRWLQEAWHKGQTNHLIAKLRVDIERAEALDRAKVDRVKSLATNLEMSPAQLSEYAQDGLRQVFQRLPADSDRADRAYRWQRNLLIAGLILYGVFQVWNALKLPAVTCLF